MGLLQPCLFLVFFSRVATAQTYSPPVPASFSRMMSVMILMLICFILILGIMAIFVRIFAKRYHPPSFQVTAVIRREPDCSTGLESSMLESFPTFAFSEVTLQTSDPLECAVCLSDFQDGETLRLITGCRHVFHAECIDMWFALHNTCPVCRANLDSKSDAAAQRNDEGRASEHVVSFADPNGEEHPPGIRSSPAVRQFRGILLLRCNTTGHLTVARGNPEFENESDAKTTAVNPNRMGRSISCLGFSSTDGSSSV